MSVNQGGIPSGFLQSTRSLKEGQAQQIAGQWDAATAARAGVRVLPPELEYKPVEFNPADLALLETQEWNSRILATAPASDSGRTGGWTWSAGSSSGALTG